MGAIDLLSRLTEYVEEVTKLTARPYLRASQYQHLYLNEADLADRAGIFLDVGGQDSKWLQIDRLISEDPPEPAAEISQWLVVPSSPTRPPTIKETIALSISANEAEAMLASGELLREDIDQTQASKDPNAQGNGHVADKLDVVLRIKNSPAISEKVREYVDVQWAQWAESEAPKRQTIKIYHKLFSLQQSLTSGSLEKPIEIIWGIGIILWNHEIKGPIEHALVEVPVELALDAKTAAISVRCLPSNPRLAEDLVNSLESDGAINFFNFSKKFLESSIENGVQISPFEKHSFEPILRSASTNLDGDGEYWPDKSDNVKSRRLPAPKTNLVITDCWALYARPRSENFILQDLRNQRVALQEMAAAGEPLPNVAKKLVRASYPSDGGTERTAGVSHAPGPPQPPSAPKPYYLPKESNADQLEILRKLEAAGADGAVVQGPPGTGKTHTIANLICHYMATGRRVLVSSHAEGALSVLRDQIPESIRSLTVSLLTNEKAGTEQLENAVREIERRTSKANPQRLTNEIQEQGERSSKLRQQIASIDSQIRAVALGQLSELGGQPKRTWEWANWVVEGSSTHAWLEDEIGPRQSPEFNDEQLLRLRHARAALGQDLALARAQLPDPSKLPDPTTLASVHSDLLICEELSDDLKGGKLPALSTNQENAEQRAKLCKRAIEALILAFRAFEDAPWLKRYYTAQNNARAGHSDHLSRLFDQVVALSHKRSSLLSVAVFVPEEIFRFGITSDVLEALDRAKSGKSPFPFIFAKKKAKELFNEIRVDGQAPVLSEDDQIVSISTFINWRVELTKFIARWNALRADFDLPLLTDGDENLGRWLSETSASIANVKAAWSHSVPTLQSELPTIFPMGVDVNAVLQSREEAQRTLDAISANLAFFRIKEAFNTVSEIQRTLSKASGSIVTSMKQYLASELGNRSKTPIQVSNGWNELLNELRRQRGLAPLLRDVLEVAELIRRSGAPKWAAKLKSVPTDNRNPDQLLPGHWRESWYWRQWDTHLRTLNQHARIHELAEQRRSAEIELHQSAEREVELRTTLELTKRLDDSMRSDLATVVALLGKMGSGKGKQAQFLRRDARKAMERCYSAIPCWIMPSWRVSEMLPSIPGSFELVIVDEASQSDIRELPVLLRGRKILVVGDDKQVSPSAIGIQISKIEMLAHKYLKDQPFGPLMRPGFSLYDLFLAIYAGQKVMLHEHFRCVEPIIRFSFQFYDEQIRPLRIPTASERLDPPLVDVHLEYGFKEKNKTNPAEADFIVNEIKRLTTEPTIKGRSIGVVSLLGPHQAALIEQKLLEAIGEELFLEYRMVCGDAATFQGKERDVMFVTMVAAPNDVRKMTSRNYQQRFNVALSRARDRMYLVRSVSTDDLHPGDLKLKVIQHFQNPMGQAASEKSDLRELCESDLELSFYDRIVDEGFRIRPQVPAGDFRIDFVIEGDGDRRLAVELDGEKWHGPDRWWADYKRQTALERMGWTFWRCWGADWALNKEACISDLKSTLERMDIHPLTGQPLPHRYTEYRPIVDPPSEDLDTVLLEEAELGAVAGDSVELELTDASETERITYFLTEQRHDPTAGVVRIDSDVGNRLLGASEGDDISIPMAGVERTAVVLAVFKGGAVESSMAPTSSLPSQPAPPQTSTAATVH